MQKRRMVRELAGAGLCNVRRACRFLELSESSYYYREKEVAPYQVKLRKRIIHLSWEFPRYGYRRIRALLNRESWRVSRKLVQRVRREEGLKVKMKPPKRRRQGKSTGLPTTAIHPNHVWSWDFVHDRTDNGGALRMMTLIDEYTRRCLSIRVARGLKSQDVLDVLHQAIGRHGAPQYIRSDNGSEFIAKIVKESLAKHPIQIIYIDPGSPWQNGFVESFHQRLRDECLNQEIFLSVLEARVIIENWRKLYNAVHPHSNLGYDSPNMFFESIQKTIQVTSASKELTPSLPKPINQTTN